MGYILFPHAVGEDLDLTQGKYLVEYWNSQDELICIEDLSENNVEIVCEAIDSLGYYNYSIYKSNEEEYENENS